MTAASYPSFQSQKTFAKTLLIEEYGLGSTGCWKGFGSAGRAWVTRVLAAQAGSRDSWQEHGQQMWWSGFSPLLCAHWSISTHGVQFHPSHPPVEYRKGSHSLGWIQHRPTSMAMAGAPSLWTEAEGPGFILLGEEMALGVICQCPYSTYEKVTMKTKTGSSEVHGGRMRDKSCRSKQGNFWLDVRKVIFLKDSQSVSRLSADTTTSPSLEVFKISWTKPWVIWGLLWAGGWARWARKVLFLPEIFWHSFTVNCYLSWKN